METHATSAGHERRTNLLELQHPAKQRRVNKSDVTYFIVKYPEFDACVRRPTRQNPGCYTTSEKDSVEFLRLLKIHGRKPTSFSVQTMQASGPSNAEPEADETEPEETADPDQTAVINEAVIDQGSSLHSTLECKTVARLFGRVSIERRSSDGYFNATSMCTACKKRFANYLRSERSEEYLDSLANELFSKTQSRVLDFDAVRASLVEVQHGGANPGSWIHERVAVDLARWLSPDFAVWMDGWILGATGASSAASQALSVTETPQPQTESSVLRVPHPPIIMEPCSSGCLDDGPPHFYVLCIPGPPGESGDDTTVFRGGRTKDFDARLPNHRKTYGDGVHMALCAPNYGHVEKLWHRLIRPHAVSNEPHEERILASKMKMNQIPGFVLELHKTRQTELELENLSQSASRKRTREEAEDDLAVAEIDAKRTLAVAEIDAKRTLAVAEIDAKRTLAVAEQNLALSEIDAKMTLTVAEAEAKKELAIAELGAKKDRLALDLERERLILQLAKDGHPDALARLFAISS